MKGLMLMKMKLFVTFYFNGKKMPHRCKNVKYVLITLLIENSQIQMSLKGKIFSKFTLCGFADF